MNRRFDAYHLPPQHFEHRSNLWWTIYIIDRKLSSLVGVPTALHDEDIALPMPPIDVAHKQDSTFALHVELSSQLGQMLNGQCVSYSAACDNLTSILVVYGLGIQRQLGAKFIASIQSILQRLAGTAEMLNTKMRIDVQKPKDTISRTAASLHLLHHQACSNLPFDPWLMD
jgi:proline utilization trans-activator